LIRQLLLLLLTLLTLLQLLALTHGGTYIGERSGAGLRPRGTGGRGCLSRTGHKWTRCSRSWSATQATPTRKAVA
jgi:hypothetical protein